MTTSSRNGTSTGTTGHRDRITETGLALVAIAAAATSWSALGGLAHFAGIHGTIPTPAGHLPLAWLIPLAVETYALIALRVWLHTSRTDRVRRAAARDATGAITLSVAGNATYHLLTMPTLNTPAAWLIVATVAVIAPVLLGRVGRLHALVTAERRALNHPPTAATPRVRRRTPIPTAPSGPTGTAHGDAITIMRNHWNTQRATGHLPTGAELDRIAGTRDYGRRLRRQWLTDEQQSQPTKLGSPNGRVPTGQR